MNATQVLGLLATGSRVKEAKLTYQSRGTEEVAVYTILLGVRVEDLYEQDLERLSLMREGLTGIEAEACDELIASLVASLALGVGNNPLYTCRDVYEHIPAPGMKMHMETGEVHLFGLKLAKETIVPGTYKEVKSRPKTIAKNRLRKELASSQFRQFALPATYVFEVEGDTLVATP